MLCESAGRTRQAWDLTDVLVAERCDDRVQRLCHGGRGIGVDDQDADGGGMRCDWAGHYGSVGGGCTFVFHGEVSRLRL